MSLGELSGDRKIFEEEDEEEEHSYSTEFVPNTSPSEAEKERWNRSGRIYQNFVQPVVEGLEDSFGPEEVMDEIRPPYSEKEIEAALEYGVEEEGLEYSNGSFSS